MQGPGDSELGSPTAFRAPMIPLSDDLDHSLERMVKHACLLLRDAQAIRRNSEESFRFGGGGGEYLLRLMALEILLKAAAVRETGELGKFRHDFPKLFEAQQADIQTAVRKEFGARGLERGTSQTGASLEQQLQRLTFNYERARYLYEASLPLTRQEREAREKSFLAGTLPIEDWDIVYYTELVELLTEVVIGHLSEWVPDWYESE